MECRSASCTVVDKEQCTSVVCTYKQISVIMDLDRSTAAFWLRKCFLPLAFNKSFAMQAYQHRFTASLACTGCYLRGTEVFLYCTWIYRFLEQEMERGRKGKLSGVEPTVLAALLVLLLCNSTLAPQVSFMKDIF